MRRAVASDLEAILALERVTDHAPHWPSTAYTGILDSADPLRCLIVAVADETLTGFAVGLMQQAPDGCGYNAELESVVVASHSRRTGIGQALCEAIFDWCRSQGATEVTLEVRSTSAGAIALYAELGFNETSRRARYYRDPEDDAVMMRLGLDTPHLSKATK